MDTKLGGDFLNSSATTTSLGGGINAANSSVFQQLEDEAVKILARLSKEHTMSDDIAKSLAKELQDKFGPMTKQSQELSERVNSILSAATAASQIGLSVSSKNENISTNELQDIIRATLTAYDVLGHTKLSQVLTKQVLPGVGADIIPPGAVKSTVARTSAQAAFANRPAETARRFIYGQLPSEYLTYGGSAVARIGPHIRRELLSTRELLRSSENLPTEENFKEQLTQDYTEKVTKVQTYLKTLQTTFDKTTEELKKAVALGDNRKAADLRRALGTLSEEIVETTKVLEEAEEDASEKRKQHTRRLMSALAPIGTHAERSLGNPVVGLLKESFKVGVDTAGAIAEMLGGGGGPGARASTGGGLLKTIGELSVVKWASGKLAPAGRAIRGLFSAGGGAAETAVAGEAAAEGAAAAGEAALLGEGAAAAGEAALLGEGAAAAGEAALLGEGAAAAGGTVLGGLALPVTLAAATAYGGYRLWKKYQNYKRQQETPLAPDTLGVQGTQGNVTETFSHQLSQASSNLQDYNTHLKATTETTQEFKLNMGKLALAAGSFGVGTQLPIVGNTIKKVGTTAVAVGAGVLAGGVNFGLGAIDMGQQYLGSYWSGATGLSMQQYLQLSGGRQNIASYLGGGVLGTEALHLGFGINDISRGYEVMQRGMPIGGMSGQQMSRLLDENAKIARALGLRLEESMQMTTTMRRTFGEANPAQMGGYIAALGADRTGHFETGFSKAIAQGFLEASRQMMMQGVAPESSVAGFGALRNVFMGRGQPEYLRTLAETNPQFITSLSNTFSGRLRAGAAGRDPWTLGLALRSGMSFEQMARGGPEATMRMLDQIMQEFPLGLMSRGGRLTGEARELLSKYAAEMGQNPDIFIGYAEATLRGDTERAKQQFRGAFGRGAAWEQGLTPGEVQRSPMYEENMRIIKQTTARLSATTEKVMGTITQINTALLKFTDKVLDSGELIYTGITKTMSSLADFFGVKLERGEGFGVKQNPSKVDLKVVHNEEELKEWQEDQWVQNARREFYEKDMAGLMTIPKSSPNSTTILEINGQVNIRQKAPSFLPEDTQ